MRWFVYHPFVWFKFDLSALQPVEFVYLDWNGYTEEYICNYANSYQTESGVLKYLLNVVAEMQDTPHTLN